MTSPEFLQGRISMREEAAALIERVAGKQPCDCVERSENGFWMDRCHCQNYGDKGQISSWCTDMNAAAALRSIPEMVASHDSDCATHNMPAYPNGPCDCSVSRSLSGEREADISTFWKELIEKDDRTSPAEYPEMALITRSELAAFVSRAIVCMLERWSDARIYA
ncbi:hypothetical protein GWE18_00495 [Bradyrhizobium sp. CSA112]|uniref:hypothetical protein n=1 Tax=Bradyrhizobium sp. CSA112 TaxID=2699170 RepID=UPI0023AEADD5|nr:hypothetical protein [Bradyrhizobium sp. CSA112]MDE5451355.1 hypothetical protein [Bradyrhizobium sp. CSA112]